MTEEMLKQVADEEIIETFEFTDDNGQDHCFVVESHFKVGKDDYVALMEVNPAIFEEEECDCGHDHAGQEHAAHVHTKECGCGHDAEAEEPEEEEPEEEELNIILAKMVTDENGEVDIQVPSDDEFEKARIAYEALEV